MTAVPELLKHKKFPLFADLMISAVPIAIWGVFVKGDTKQTLFGLFGGLLFWTGWVEFLYGYFAARFGVHYDLVGSGIVQTTTEYVNGIGVRHEMLINGINVNDIPAAELKAMRGSRPEYLIMPASFGFWVMFIVLYLFGSIGMTISQGGLGAYPVLVWQALALYGVGEAVGLAAGWLLWSSQQVIIIVVGLAYLIYFSLVKRRNTAATSQPESNTDK